MAWPPEGMKLRSISGATRLARRDKIDPRDLLELSPRTRRRRKRGTIERAESRQQALALLLMFTEFQRR